MNSNNKDINGAAVAGSLLVATALSACGGGSDGSSGPDYSHPYYSSVRTTNDEGAVEASRFLSQSTFGSNQYEINWLLDNNLDFNAWIDHQANLPATLHSSLPHGEYQNGRLEAWFKAAVEGSDQLRQRMAWSLSQIFVISDLPDLLHTKPESTFGYYDMLVQHSLGNFRDLLESVTRHLSMGFYLSLKNSQKSNSETGGRPDENYAREVMQLFTIGLHELNADGSVVTAGGQAVPTYTQQDIMELSRALTGWSSTESWRWKYNFHQPMVAYNEYHDTDSKTFLNQTLPAGQTAEQDLSNALDILFNHPNVGPFIGKQLIQRLVTSNPSTDYVSRVTAVFNDNGSGIRGDLLAVVRAILTDQEARRLHDESEGFGKVREPILKQTHLWRAFDKSENTFSYHNPEKDFLQAPLRSPSVFNFYYPDFAPSGDIKDRGMVAPELQIVTDSSMTTSTNRMFVTALGDMWNTFVELDLEDPLKLSGNFDLLIGHLDLLLTHGTMTLGLRNQLKSHYDATSGESSEERVRDLIFLIASSAEYAVQQ